MSLEKLLMYFSSSSLLCKILIIISVHKIKIAIVGFGSHVLKRVIPAISKIKTLKLEYVLVRDTEKYKTDYKLLKIKFRDINKKIPKDIKWIYISTPIFSHFQLVDRFIEENKNIICEKPLTESLEKTSFLIKKSQFNNLTLHEVNMYKHHKQFKNLKKILK